MHTQSNVILKIKPFLLCFVFLLSFGLENSILAQRESDSSEVEKPLSSRKEKRKQDPKYFGIATGLNSSTFRDFATSPLFYSGRAIQVKISKLRIGEEREAEFGISYDFGNYVADFNESKTTSKVKRVELSFSRLYRVGLFGNEKYNSKFGFLVSGNGNLRNNASLQNNAIGMDAFANILGSLKITKDISRFEATEKKFLFWRYSRKARSRKLALRLNVGVLNGSFRNGYVYSRQFAVVNEPKAFEEYELKLFSGYRFSSDLVYTHYLNNKNAIQLAYGWDAYSTGGDLDKLEMAHHVLKFSLLFNSNNK